LLHAFADQNLLTGKRQRAAGARKQLKQKRKTGPPERKKLEPPAGSPFMTIQQAGKKFFGLSKNGSYDAAERGDFGELYVIGRRKFVVINAIEARIKAKSTLQAAE
jgi:hypothetical protein